ncbi:hypothetical protein HOY80DRAFT_888539 [Tuber brumale]|nr:hypothetical protein HOY80DRAFT_888539 [Tuber brumale]
MGHIKIDPFAANRPFRGQVTPTSSSPGSREHSPATPQDGQPLRTPLHNGSLSPNPQSRNHHQPRKDSSSSSSYNIESPFTLFKPAIVSPVSPRTPPGAAATTSSFYPNSDLYAPVSPLSGGSRAVAARMNNIAPGPFGVGSGNSSRERTPEMVAPSSRNPLDKGPARVLKGGDSETLPVVAASFTDKKEGRVKSPTGEHSVDSRTMRRSREAVRGSREHGGEREQKSTSSAERLTSLPSQHRKSQSPGGTEARMRRKEQNPPQVPSLSHSAARRNGEESPLDPVSPYTHRAVKSEVAPSIPKMDALRLDTRSHTFPIKNDSKSPSGRQPPHPGLGLPRSPSVTVKNHIHRRNKSSANLAKGLPPPPEDNLPPALPAKDQAIRRRPSVGADTMSSGRLDRRSGSKLPTLHRLSPPRADEYTHYSLGNPYDLEAPVEQSTSHIPSPSMSSNTSSVFSHNSKSSRSSMSSPTIPETSQVPKPPPKPSRGSRGRSKDSNGYSDIDGLMKELQSSMQELQPSAVQPKRPVEGRPRDKPRVPSHERAAPPPLKSHHHHHQPSPSKSPIDYEKPLPNLTEPPLAPGLPQASPLPPLKDKRPRAPPLVPPQSPPKTQAPVDEPLPAPTRRRTTASKGNCRGCGEAIVGKSISSADGRLTGRYHKACFVCQDCREPFQSVEFYVLDNSPYCHRHYHKLNHSLCPSCDRGIEGPCLETEMDERFHPNCFRCYDCRCELSGDYFDFNGRPYCERHAFRMARGMQNGNGNLGASRSPANMERRKTKLMFM